GARHRADQQGAAGEESEGLRILEQQKADVLERVPRRRQRAQRQPSEVEFLTIVETAVRERALALRRRQDLRTVCSKLPAAGEEVGMQMRVGCERDIQLMAPRGLNVWSRITRRIDDQRPAITEIDEVRAVAESLVDEGVDVHRCPAMTRYPRYGTARATRGTTHMSLRKRDGRHRPRAMKRSAPPSPSSPRNPRTVIISNGPERSSMLRSPVPP